eukprot:NODE_781_length_3919_cov_1.323037.p1 type:complete len:320 gc:universal NODE_781_length_3919_cov_1.323037:2696-1737(-)
MISVDAPMNMALIKYWGKSDTIHIIPCNESISISLSVYTNTKIEKSNENLFLLNGIQQSLSDHPRIDACLSKFKEICTFLQKEWFPVKITTNNEFPTSSGLASSASGGAALAKGLNEVYQLHLNQLELSVLARLVSGSACRSIYDGFAKWQFSTPIDSSISHLLPHSECHAIQIPSKMHFYALIYILNKNQKAISSTNGMQQTVKTSQLFQSRLTSIPFKINQMQLFIQNMDYKSIFTLMMQDAMNFHACCLDSWPPIHYLNDYSYKLIDLVHQFNENTVKCGYTFDAGANCVILFENVETRNEFKKSNDFECIECEST